MPWFILLVSSVLEAVWANALGASESFTKLAPSLIFVAALIPGMWTLAYVTQRIPMSIAYALWAGLGTAFTVGWAMASGSEPMTVARLLLVATVAASVIGLKVITSKQNHDLKDPSR